jgi:siroheme synthase
VLTADLATLPAKVAAAGISSPALIIVGTVVRLHEKLAWFSRAAAPTGSRD